MVLIPDMAKIPEKAYDYFDIQKQTYSKREIRRELEEFHNTKG